MRNGGCDLCKFLKTSNKIRQSEGGLENTISHFADGLHYQQSHTCITCLMLKLGQGF